MKVIPEASMKVLFFIFFIKASNSLWTKWKKTLGKADDPPDLKLYKKNIMKESKNFCRLESYDDDFSILIADREIRQQSYNETYKKMRTKIIQNFSSDCDLDSTAYKKFVEFKTRLFKGQKSKRINQLYLLSCTTLFTRSPTELNFKIKYEQRIEFIKASLNSLTHEVVLNIPEIVGLAFKFVERINELNDRDFLSTLLQFDFCINIMKKSPKEEIYKDIVSTSTAHMENPTEYKYCSILKNLRNIYHTLWLADVHLYDDFDVYLNEIRYISKDTLDGLKVILFLLEPNEAANILKTVKEILYKEEYCGPLFLENSTVVQCTKLLYDLSPDIFGCWFESIESDLLKNPKDIKKQFELIGKTILNSFC
ncbi:hypothetical protein NGRA_0016 [Nosema granulosis]|uniref:Uncharacterized protein n=1 Tax=Nosema granulosis TaxID=83296 RepID=A0A9P6KZZ2_9MICR|nr:hypothetical protein NGRA_0016 [Nosema granulosis]